MGYLMLDGFLFRLWVTAGADALAECRDRVNDMNVFPVPDGDTGTNMGMTIDAVASAKADAHLGRAASSIARAMMRAARGNSGVILSMFFRGVANSLADCEAADPARFLAALRDGAMAACNAVERPVEGTILTVMRDCCMGLDGICDFVVLFDGLCAGAKESLEHTPDLLPVLKKANVVDAGGYGFLCVLQGMCRAAHGEKTERTTRTAEAAASRSKEKHAPFDAFDTTEIRYTYCTECLVDLPGALPDSTVSQIRQTLTDLGDSIVLTADVDMLKVHVHTNHPLAVFSMLFPLGTVRSSKVENMKLQHSELISTASAPEKRKKYGIFAVASGEGFETLFRDLGVDEVVAGGQSMNPSADDLLRAMANCPCECAILLPNNSNIVLTAKQAASLCTDRKVLVVPTKTVPQGISAVLAFDAETSPEENLEAMSQAASAVTTYSLTRAVRDAEADGLSVHEGQFLGLRDGTILSVADDLTEAAAGLFADVPACDTVTLYRGVDVDDACEGRMEQLLTDRFGSRADVCAVSGGQPLYPFVISVE